MTEDEHMVAQQLAMIEHYIYQDGKWVVSPQDQPDQLATFEQKENGPVQHHVFEDGKWIARPSKPHPVVMAELRPMPKEHKALGQKAPMSRLKPLIVRLIADSGCMS